MPLKLRYTSRDLQFRFDARTSRGQIRTHKAWYLGLSDSANPDREGWGEAAPLAGLSIDFRPDFEEKLADLCRTFNALNPTDFAEAQSWLQEQRLENWPSQKFALETAFADLKNGGQKLFYDTAFTRGETGIPINGLVWMGEEAFMQRQISEKLQQGYTCLKLKIGGLDFETELKILASVREVTGPEQLTIRLDANGAFSPENAMEKLEKLSRYTIHSLEQPIQPKQFRSMAALCRNSPIPVALDEELIGINGPEKQTELLETIKPPYIILKPTMVGGLEASRNWIKLAEERNIGWWITSALESNIGLNAIAQFTATFPDLIPQGLGTGQLYHNNMASPLQIELGQLHYRKEQSWGSIEETNVKTL